MGSQPFHSRLPVVRSESLELARLGSLSGIGPRKWLRFTQNISWLREASATVILSHGGVVIKEAGTYIDSGGYLTALSSAVEAAKSQCQVYGVSAQSSMTISVRLEIVDTPNVLCDRPVHGITSGNYFLRPESPDSSWFHYSEEKMLAYESAKTAENRETAWEALDRLENVDVLCLESAWTSNSGSDAESMRALDQIVRAESEALLVLLAGATRG